MFVLGNGRPLIAPQGTLTVKEYFYFGGSLTKDIQAKKGFDALLLLWLWNLKLRKNYHLNFCPGCHFSTDSSVTPQTEVTIF